MNVFFVYNFLFIACFFNISPEFTFQIVLVFYIFYSMPTVFMIYLMMLLVRHYSDRLHAGWLGFDSW
jgi:hypothetical protein